MKFNYTIKQLNSPFDDNAVFLRNVYMRKAVLFDCGRLGNLDNSELADISHVFISHTHMDHFGGFDRFLRGCLNSGNTIVFMGPEGIIGNVAGKLRGYNWNLIKDYDLTFQVIELSPGKRLAARFSAKNSFKQEDMEIDCQGPLAVDCGFTVEYDFFDHGITSVGYRLKEPINITIIKERLEKLGLMSGPWLKDFKTRLASGDKCGQIEAPIFDGIKSFDVQYLEDNIVEYKKPQDVTYITDIAPTDANIEKAIMLASGSNLLIIEAVFMDADVEHAVQKNHLTIGKSKEILHKSRADYVRFLHFASRYDRFREDFFSELRSGVENKFFPFEKRLES